EAALDELFVHRLFAVTVRPDGVPRPRVLVVCLSARCHRVSSGLRPLRCIPDRLRKAAACGLARRALGAADGNVDLPRGQRAGCFVARWRRSNYREGTTLTEAVVSGLVRN